MGHFLTPLYLGIASGSVTVALAGLAVRKVPESGLTLVAATAERVLGAPALSVSLSAEGVERPLVVAIACCKAPHFKARNKFSRL